MPAQDPASADGRRRRLFMAMLVLCVVGLAAAIELTVVHVRACQDLASQSFCAFNENFDCDVVARSKYSVFLRVPVAVWGIFGYLAMGLVALWGRLAKDASGPTGLMLGLTSGSVLTSAVLATISVLKIDTICVVCMATYVINLALLILCLLQVRREGVGASVRGVLDSVRDDWRRSILVGVLGAVAVGILISQYPQYWVASAQAGPLGVTATASTVTIDGLATGETQEGHPWIGAENPKLVIEEFSDYQCPFCSQAHWVMRELVEANPDEVRLIHRHYPLDKACNPIVQREFHPRSCVYSAIAACAGEQGRFWQANDYLFEHGRDEGPFNVGDLCTAAGVDEKKLRECMEQRAARHLEQDLMDGIRLRIMGTPTFKINGKLYMGELPEDVLGPYLKKLEEKLEREVGKGE